MTTFQEMAETVARAAKLIRQYDNAAKRVIDNWESGDLAEAVRELERVYRREA